MDLFTLLSTDRWMTKDVLNKTKTRMTFLHTRISKAESLLFSSVYFAGVQDINIQLL